MIFSNDSFQKNSGIPSQCQTVWIQIRPDIVRPDLGPNCLQRLTTASSNKQKI